MIKATSGARLPPVRQLANDLGVAPGTVAKAYQQLEETGITTAHRRRGTTVKDRTTTSEEDRLTNLATAASVYADTARLLNVAAEQATQLVVAAFRGIP